MTQMDVGQTIGNYRIEALIGDDTVGQVYRAQHISLNQQAAIKLLRADFSSDPTFLTRFSQEIGQIAQLRHPNIVTLYDVGSVVGRAYQVMEWMPDGSLHAFLNRDARRAELSLDMVVDLVRQAADGLAFAHSQGVLHRDVKPDNLLLRRDGGPYTLKIVDFGLAPLIESSGLIATGFAVASPDYMSPEQCKGLDLDGRSDVYSLGVILYELATGQLPFESASLSQAIANHVYSVPTAPRQIRPELPEALEQIILRCLAKQRNERFTLAADLSGALSALSLRSTPAVAHATVQADNAFASTVVPQPVAPAASLPGASDDMPTVVPPPVVGAAAPGSSDDMPTIVPQHASPTSDHIPTVVPPPVVSAVGRLGPSDDMPTIMPQPTTPGRDTATTLYQQPEPAIAATGNETPTVVPAPMAGGTDMATTLYQQPEPVIAAVGDETATVVPQPAPRRAPAAPLNSDDAPTIISPPEERATAPVRDDVPTVIPTLQAAHPAEEEQPTVMVAPSTDEPSAPSVPPTKQHSVPVTSDDLATTLAAPVDQDIPPTVQASPQPKCEANAPAPTPAQPRSPVLPTGTQAMPFGMPTPVFSALPRPKPIPQVQVMNSQGQELRVVDLTGDGLAVGRLPDNDLPLDSQAVSERHVQIDWNGNRITVTDLGSKNGSLLAGTRLQPNEPRTWDPGANLQIGPFWLRLTPATAVAPTVMPVAPLSPPPSQRATPSRSMQAPRPQTPAYVAPMSAPRSLSPAPSMVQSPMTEIRAQTPPSVGAPPDAGGMTQPYVNVSRIGVTLDNEVQSFTPGQSSVVRMTLTNTGPTVDHLTVTVEGVPANWIQGNPPAVQLNPNTQAPYALNVNVPRAPESRAAAYPVTVRARSRQNPNESGTALAQWTVQPFADSSLEVKPKRVNGWRKANYTLIVRNAGNTPANYTLNGDDDEQALDFRMQNERISLDPGATAKLKLGVYGPPRWLGSSQPRSFTMHSKPERVGEMQLATAQFVQRALIPPWLIPLLFATLIGFLAYGYIRVPGVPTRVVAGIPGPGFLNPTPTPIPPTATATPTLTPTPTATPTLEPTLIPTPILPTPVPPTPVPPPPTPIPPPTATPTPTPPGESCVAGVPYKIVGRGPPKAPFLLYFGKRVVSGGTVGEDGSFEIELRVGDERPGLYPVTVRLRETNQTLRQFNCLVPTPLPTPLPNR
jgi:serine/threonine protein kinase